MINTNKQYLHHLQFTLLTIMILNAQQSYANSHLQDLDTEVEKENTAKAVLPTIQVQALNDLDPIRSYIGYDEAQVSRNHLKIKYIPQTINTIDVQKYKMYGSNDLSIMLQGTPGVSTTYDTRGDGIMIRGFSADAGDIYRDGIRESGQIRRSTANVERIEILKGPASVLYGRSQGGGVVNMVTKYANFDSKSSVGMYVGSYDYIGANLDLNKVLNDNWAVRFTAEQSDSNSFRKGIGTQIQMFSPSVSYRNDDQTLKWTTQYTYDEVDRTPDRGPSYENLPKGVSIKTGFATADDFIVDKSHTIRTDLSYQYLPDWKFHWGLSYREAEQNFDNFFGGTYCNFDGIDSTGKPCNWQKGYIRQNYAWQNTLNTTTTNTFDLSGKFKTGQFDHQLMIGSDLSFEKRNPTLGNYSSGSTAIYGYINPFNTNQYDHSIPSNIRHTPTSINQHNAQNLGIFVQDLIRLHPNLQLMLGLRYDKFDFQSKAFLSDSKPVYYVKQYADHSFSPNAGLVWQPTDAHSLYMSYSKSFSPYGGRGNIALDNIQNASVLDADPQYNVQYEIGIKSDWLDERLNTQLSLYEITKDNVRYRPDAINRPNDWEVGQQQKSQGLEFSFIGRVLDNVFVRGGYGYTDAKWSSDTRNNISAADNLNNKHLKDISKHNANIFVRYLPTDKIYTEVGATYVSPFFTTDKNTTEIEGWTRFDAALGYKDEHWGMSIAVNNLSNKEYWRSSSMPGMPRNVLFRMNYTF